MAVLLFLAITTYGSLVLSGVVEEKTSRVVEVLLARVPARNLLAGKVAGIGLLGLGQVAVTALAAVAAMALVDSFNVPAARGSVIAWAVVWFVLGYALYAMAFGTLGSLASRTEDAQSVAGPVTVVLIVAYFASPSPRSGVRTLRGPRCSRSSRQPRPWSCPNVSRWAPRHGGSRSPPPRSPSLPSQPSSSSVAGCTPAPSSTRGRAARHVARQLQMSTRRVIYAGTLDITRRATPTNPLPRHPDPTGRPEPHPTVIAPVVLSLASRDAAGLYEVVVGHHRWTYPPNAYVGRMTDDDAGRILCDAQRSDRA